MQANIRFRIAWRLKWKSFLHFIFIGWLSLFQVQAHCLGSLKVEGIKRPAAFRPASCPLLVDFIFLVVADKTIRVYFIFISQIRFNNFFNIITVIIANPILVFLSIVGEIWLFFLLSGSNILRLLLFIGIFLCLVL